MVYYELIKNPIIGGLNAGGLINVGLQLGLADELQSQPNLKFSIQTRIFWI